MSAKSLQVLQSDTFIVILTAPNVDLLFILNRQDYLENCMDHKNNGLS